MIDYGLFAMAWATGPAGAGFATMADVSGVGPEHFAQGLCGPLALALSDVIEGDCGLAAVCEAGEGLRVHHWLVWHNNSYLDCYGSWSPARLLSYWRLRLSNHRLLLRPACEQEIAEAIGEKLLALRSKLAHELRKSFIEYGQDEFAEWAVRSYEKEALTTTSRPLRVATPWEDQDGK